MFAEATAAKCLARLLACGVRCLFQQPRHSLALTLKGFLGCLRGPHRMFAGKCLRTSTFAERPIQGFHRSIPVQESNLTCYSGMSRSNSFSASGFCGQRAPCLQVLHTDENQRAPRSLPSETPRCRGLFFCSQSRRLLRAAGWLLLDFGCKELLLLAPCHPLLVTGYPLAALDPEPVTSTSRCLFCPWTQHVPTSPGFSRLGWRETRGILCMPLKGAFSSPQTLAKFAGQCLLSYSWTTGWD